MATLPQVKEYEDSLQAAKDSWENGEERLKSIVTRAQNSLQNRRSDLEKALAKLPNEESSIREDLNRIRLSVSVLGGKVRGVEGRVAVCENEDEVNAAALEKVSMDVADIRGKLSEGRSVTSMSVQTENTNSETSSSSITSSPIAIHSNLDSSVEYSSQTGAMTSNLSSDWVEAFDSDSRNETASLQSSNDEEFSANLPLFDPPATVTFPDPSSSLNSSFTHPSRPLSYATKEYKRQRAVISVVDHIGATGRLEACLQSVLTIRDTIFGDHGCFSSRLHESFIVLLGKPGSLQRRRFWAVVTALIATFLLIIDPWEARRVSERPAYEAFQRRRNLFYWSTPDIIDGILTYYLTVFMYFIYI